MSDAVTRLNTALEGRYAIEREIGEGGMATVYLADDIKHSKSCQHVPESLHRKRTADGHAKLLAEERKVQVSSLQKEAHGT